MLQILNLRILKVHYDINEGSPLLAQNEVRADIFSGSLAVFQSERVASAGGRKGGGGIPPALQMLGEICSNFFESTPPSPRCSSAMARQVRLKWPNFKYIYMD